MTKKSHVKDIISRYNFNPENLVFFGDSNSDIEAAESKGIPFILLKNDFNTNLCNNYEGEIIKNFHFN